MTCLPVFIVQLCRAVVNKLPVGLCHAQAYVCLIQTSARHKTQDRTSTNAHKIRDFVDICCLASVDCMNATETLSLLNGEKKHYMKPKTSNKQCLKVALY